MAYLMESADEGTRLAAKTDRAIVDEELALTGLRTGTRALDAGCASGAVTLAIADRVGPTGVVTGVDLSAERLEEARLRLGDRATFHCARLEQLPFEAGAFDYVMCRLVLEYAAQPQPIVDELARVCAPGGRVVLADIDGYASFHHPLAGERAEAIEAITALLRKTGFDPYVGRKLYAFARAAKLQNVRVHVRPYHVIAGPIDSIGLENWRYKLQTLAPLGHRELGAARYDAYVKALVELLLDEDAFTYSVIMLAVGDKA